MKRHIAFSLVALVAVLAASYMLYLRFGMDCVRGSGHVVSQERETKPFDSVSADGTVTVHLKISNVSSLAVSAEDSVLDSVTTRTDNGVLRIALKDVCVIGGLEPVVVTVSAPRYSSVTAGNLARVVSESVLDSYSLTLSASNGARIDATVDAVDLKTLASDGGTVGIGGYAERHDAYATSRGQILAYGVRANETSARAENFGWIQTYSLDSILARADSTSGIYYMGPGALTSQNTEGGTVEKTG